MTRTKEKIKTITYKADRTVEHTTERMGTVYKKKDSREWAHHGQVYLQVVRENGLAVIHAYPPNVEAPTAQTAPVAIVAAAAATVSAPQAAATA